MLKSLATAYEPSKRSDHWVKVKRCGHRPALPEQATLVSTAAALPPMTGLVAASTLQCSLCFLATFASKHRLPPVPLQGLLRGAARHAGPGCHRGLVRQRAQGGVRARRRVVPPLSWRTPSLHAAPCTSAALPLSVLVHVFCFCLRLASELLPSFPDSQPLTLQHADPVPLIPPTTRSWFSPFLLACYDPEAEELQSVCRVMSGFTDAFYREAKDRWAGVRVAWCFC